MTDELRLQTDAAKRRRDWIELGVIALVFVLPGTVDLLFQPEASSDPSNFAATAVSGTIQTAGWACLALLLMHRSGDPWSFFGVRRFRAIRDLGGAFAIFGASELIWRAYAASLRPVIESGGYWSDDPWSQPSAWWEFPLSIVWDDANASAEELMIRGIVLHRLCSLLGSAPKAILISALAFAAYHAYYGLAGVVSIFLTGLVYGAVVIALRSVWPAVIGHAVGNIYMSFGW